MPTSFAKSISRRVFEPPPQRGFARHLLCDIGAEPLSAASQHDKNGLYAALRRWRWQLPPPAYRHEHLPRPLHLIAAASLRRRYHVEERLLAATLDWSCDTFCDLPPTAATWDTVIYKSLAMLEIIGQCATSAQLSLISSATAHDVYMLIGIKMFSSGVFSATAYRRFLHAGGQHHNQLHLPVTANKDIAALLIPRPPRPLLTPTNPLNHCLTPFDSVQQIPQLLLDTQPAEVPQVWQRRNEHDIIDMAAELLD